MRNLAKLFGNAGLLIWIFLPLTAGINNYIEQQFLGSKWEQLTQNLPQDETYELPFQTAPSDEEQNGEENEEEEEESFSLFKSLASIKDTLKSGFSSLTGSLSGKIDHILNYADESIDNMFQLFILFLITTVIIPIGSLILLYLVMKQLNTKQVS